MEAFLLEPSLVLRASAALLLGLACTGRGGAAPLDGPPNDLKASAAALYQAYGQAIATGDRAAIAPFYHHQGALRVLNGTPQHLSRAAIDARYRGPWNPPVYFRWEGLAFDSINPGQVIVTGGFKWRSMGQTDTVAYIYAALVEAVDSGMAIRFEHETAAPR